MVTTVHLSIMSLSLLHLTTLGQAQKGISGDLQELFDRFPNPGNDFMLQIPILYRDYKNNENSWTNAPQPWGQIMLTIRYKSLPIPQPGVSGD